MKIKVITLCSGYDSQCMALDVLMEQHPDFDYELVAWSEFDPESKQPIDKQPAVIAHNALYPYWKDRNLGDMTKIDWEKLKGEHIDLLTYSTPCTDVSSAGYQQGIAEGSGTRSSILWYTRNAIKALHPKFLLMENVKALVSKKFKPDFDRWLAELRTMGYENYWSIVNGTDVNVPQNRERVFVVSVRQDSFDEPEFRFPQKQECTRTVEDLLEPKVDEKYYLCDEQVQKVLDKIAEEDD